MELDIIKKNPNIEISKNEVSDLLNIASWKTQPEFYFPGRTAYLKISAKNKINNDRYYYAKIKGVGFWNPKTTLNYRGVHNVPFTVIPQEPNALKEYTYTSKIPHVGFNENGEFMTKRSAPVPLGGIIYEKATNEYETSLRLIENGVSSSCPFLLIKINDRCFQGKQLGIVITLIKSKYLQRLNQLFYKNGICESQKELRFQSELKSYLSLDKDNNASELLGNIMYLYGCELRKFSKAGVFRHSGGLDNLYFDFKSGKVIFTDLDSSLFLNEIKEPRKTLEILRDLSSSLIKFTERSLKKAGNNKIIIKSFIKQKPFINFYRGYFYKYYNINNDLINVICLIFKRFSYSYARDHRLYNKKTFTCLIIYLTNEILRYENTSFINKIDSNLLHKKIKNFLDDEQLKVFDDYLGFFNQKKLQFIA